MAIPTGTTSTLLSTDIKESEMQTMVSRVDESGARRIMSMLVDMYANPTVAVVREYLANAVDATILEGSVEPVRVTIPTALTPNLVIADRGTGMTAREVENHFLAFAASTKRDTNDLVGELGVGAKSAWTLCESFVIDTTKDGKRTVVRASRDLAHNVLMYDVETDQPSGTTITIPMETTDINWECVVQRVASAHDQGAVLVNEKPVKSIHSGDSWIGPMRAGLPIESALYVVAGGTLFGVPAELRKMITDETMMSSGALRLPVGSFDHTPSRESLIATDRTKHAITKALGEFHKVYTRINDALNILAETDLTAAALRRATILHDAPQSPALPLDYKVKPADGTIFTRHYGSRGRTHVWSLNRDSAGCPLVDIRKFLNEILVVTDTPGTRAPRGMTTYMREMNPARTVVLLPRGVESMSMPIVRLSTGKDTGQVWTIGRDHVRTITYETLRAGVAEVMGDKPVRTYPVLVTDAEGKGSKEYYSLAKITSMVQEDPELRVLYNTNLHEAPEYLQHALIINTEHYSPNPVIKAIPSIMSFTVWHKDYLNNKYEHLTDDEMDALVAGSGRYVGIVRFAGQVMKHLSSDHPLYETIKRLDTLREVASRDDIRQARAHLQDARVCVTDEANSRILELESTIYKHYPLLRAGVRFGYGSVSPSEMEHFVQYVVHTPPHPVPEGQED